MALFTLIVSNGLIALGLAGYITTGMEHPTALIPTGFGLVMEPLGIAALIGGPGIRKHAMHVAVAIALIGLLGTAGGLVNGVRILTGAEVERPGALPYQAGMALLCAVYVIAGIRAFLYARRCPGRQGTLDGERASNTEFEA